MNIAVFGSTGNVGRLLVGQALAEGYDVIAYARNPPKLTITHDHLTVIQGELSDEVSRTAEHNCVIARNRFAIDFFDLV